jgi:hypothetical protein
MPLPTERELLVCSSAEAAAAVTTNDSETVQRIHWAHNQRRGYRARGCTSLSRTGCTRLTSVRKVLKQGF